MCLISFFFTFYSLPDFFDVTLKFISCTKRNSNLNPTLKRDLIQKEVESQLSFFSLQSKGMKQIELKKKLANFSLHASVEIKDHLLLFFYCYLTQSCFISGHEGSKMYLPTILNAGA